MTPASHQDLLLADFVHEAASVIGDHPHHVSGLPAYRFGDRKVFISALHTVMVRLWADRPYGDRDDSVTDAAWADIVTFKAWLLRAMRMHDSAGRPLVVMARADLVAAMHHEAVAASELTDRGTTFHFVLDRNIAVAEYQALAAATQPMPRIMPQDLNTKPMRRIGRVGGGR